MEHGQSSLEDLVADMSFWQGKRVFITGHTGFKGSWLSLWLQGLGAEVTGFALPPAERSLFNSARVAKGMASIYGDIRNLTELQSAMETCHPQVVIHMAAQALVRPSYEQPVETFAINVMGTINLLEAVRQSDSTRVVINVTSDKCYENQEWHWGYRETDPLGGYDPYSCSKGCAELVSSSYRRSFFQDSKVSLASVRAGNVIGGGDWSDDRLIPDLIKGLINRTPIIIRYPDAIRPWQFVCEPLAGYLLLAEKMWHGGDTFAGAWNFGPNDDDSTPVAQIADYCCSHWEDPTHWQHSGETAPHEASHLKLDCSKAKNLLGWRPKLDLGQILEWTMEWYRAFAANEEMRGVTEQQIKRYREKLLS